MKKLKNSSFSVTISLQAGNSYQFRYVLDGNIWVNDLNVGYFMEGELCEVTRSIVNQTSNDPLNYFSSLN